ncbi:MAG: hypothetical protein EOO11_21750, partial [Chitinophagaceae bacterium]
MNALVYNHSHSHIGHAEESEALRAAYLLCSGTYALGVAGYALYEAHKSASLTRPEEKIAFLERNAWLVEESRRAPLLHGLKQYRRLLGLRRAGKAQVLARKKIEDSFGPLFAEVLGAWRRVAYAGKLCPLAELVDGKSFSYVLAEPRDPENSKDLLKASELLRTGMEAGDDEGDLFCLSASFFDSPTGDTVPRIEGGAPLPADGIYAQKMLHLPLLNDWSPALLRSLRAELAAFTSPLQEAFRQWISCFNNQEDTATQNGRWNDDVLPAFGRLREALQRHPAAQTKPGSACLEVFALGGNSGQDDAS